MVQAQEGDTQVTLKELAPVRLIKNKFFQELQALYTKGTNPEELKAHLGRARAKRGMFEGDLEDGELEIGQVSAMIHEIKPVKQIFQELIQDFEEAQNKMKTLSL